MTKRISIILAITLIFTMCFGCISADAATKSKLPKTSITKISVSGSNGVYLKWSKANKAVKYKVYRSTKATSGYKIVKTTKKLSWTDKGLKYSKKYYYKIKAVNKKGKGLLSKYRSIKTKAKPVKKPAPPKTEAKTEELQPVKADSATVMLSGRAIQIGETKGTLLADYGEPVDKLTSCRGWIDYIYQKDGAGNLTMVGVADGKVVAVTSFDESVSFIRGGYSFKYGDKPISGHEPAYGCANYYDIPGMNFVAYYDGETLIGCTVRDESFAAEHSVYEGYRTNFAAVREGEETEARYITNALRAKNGLKKLKPLDMLREFTRAKSDDMAKHNYVSHTDSDGSNVMIKFEKKMDQLFAGKEGYYEGYCNNNTENITAGSADALQAVMSIYNSDLHRAWMLDNYGEFQYDYMEMSLSFTDNAKYHVYWTQGFVSDSNKLI